MTTPAQIKSPMSIFAMPPNILIGLTILAFSMVGFLTYFGDWVWVCDIYNMRILLMPLGISILIYPQIPPLYVFLIAIIMGVFLYFGT